MVEDKIERVKEAVDALIAMGPQERKRPQISPLAFSSGEQVLMLFLPSVNIST